MGNKNHELEDKIQHLYGYIERLIAQNDILKDRLKKLESFIIDTRGELPDVAALYDRQVAALSAIMPEIHQFAATVTRGTGSAKNYENQYRHAEYRAKMVKQNLVAAKKLMAGMIVAVSSVADRTLNSINPEDIHHLRAELDTLTANHSIIRHVEVDTFLDGLVPELNLMEGTGVAHLVDPVPAYDPASNPLTKFAEDITQPLVDKTIEILKREGHIPEELAPASEAEK